jgi:hypothetical protein
MYLVIVLCAVGVTVALSLTQTNLRAAEVKPHDTVADRIHELRVERRELLRQIATADQIIFKKGQGSADEVRESMLALRTSELELCTTPEEHIQVHQQIVDSMRQLEDHAVSLFNAKVCTQREVIKAKAARLKAEIDLAEVKLAANSTPTSKPIQ